MKQKLKKLFAYYRPYKGLFYSDMFFEIGRASCRERV